MMTKVEVPEGSKGDWTVKRFVPKHLDFSALSHGRASVSPGETYTGLYRKGCVIMSDTPAELRDHAYAARLATGSCLINGFGLGAILKAILSNPEVTDVTVIEISQDVIDLVGPTYSGDSRVQIICADAYAFAIPAGKRYNWVWHDIWDNLCTDNLSEMARLHRKYGRRCDWQGSWGKEICQYEQRKQRREELMWAGFKAAFNYTREMKEKLESALDGLPKL